MGEVPMIISIRFLIVMLPNPITGGSAPFTGTFAPEGDLSVLNGEFSAGTWTLTVFDDAGW
jgi:subtilisin-like proprotein convertase family protein